MLKSRATRVSWLHEFLLVAGAGSAAVGRSKVSASLIFNGKSWIPLSRERETEM